MTHFDIIEAINSPGAPGTGGDDRFGFDASAGTAWVLDGATDATDLAPFPRAESGAAWLAQAVSDGLMATAPHAGEPAEAYIQRVLTAVRARAEAESDIPLASLPGEAWPIASGIWARARGSEIEFNWMGDCIALELSTGAVIGPVDAAVGESTQLRGIDKLTREGVWAQVRADRRRGFDARTPLFGLRPNVVHMPAPVVRPANTGDGYVLMSDGFYRLIEPYGMYDGPALARAIKDKGLTGLISELRTFEASDAACAMPRVKRADDACALWLECV